MRISVVNRFVNSDYLSSHENFTDRSSELETIETKHDIFNILKVGLVT